MTLLCINMHCWKKADENIMGKEQGDFYCSEECKLEDELREKAGLNDEKWKTKTHVENGKLVIDG